MRFSYVTTVESLSKVDTISAEKKCLFHWNVRFIESISSEKHSLGVEAISPLYTITVKRDSTVV